MIPPFFKAGQSPQKTEIPKEHVELLERALYLSFPKDCHESEFRKILEPFGLFGVIWIGLESCLAVMQSLQALNNCLKFVFYSFPFFFPPSFFSSFFLFFLSFLLSSLFSSLLFSLPFLLLSFLFPSSPPPPSSKLQFSLHTLEKSKSNHRKKSNLNDF